MCTALCVLPSVYCPVCTAQISTYFYEIKRIASPKVGVTSGLQIEDNTGQDTHGVQTYKLFLIQVRSLSTCNLRQSYNAVRHACLCYAHELRWP